MKPTETSKSSSGQTSNDSGNAAGKPIAISLDVDYFWNIKHISFASSERISDYFSEIHNFFDIFVKFWKLSEKTPLEQAFITHHLTDPIIPFAACHLSLGIPSKRMIRHLFNSISEDLDNMITSTDIYFTYFESGIRVGWASSFFKSCINEHDVPIGIVPIIDDSYNGATFFTAYLNSIKPFHDNYYRTKNEVQFRIMLRQFDASVDSIITHYFTMEYMADIIESEKARRQTSRSALSAIPFERARIVTQDMWEGFPRAFHSLTDEQVLELLHLLNAIPQNMVVSMERKDLLAFLVNRLYDLSQNMPERDTSNRAHRQPEYEQLQEEAAQRLGRKYGLKFSRLPETVYPGMPIVTSGEITDGRVTKYTRQSVQRAEDGSEIFRAGKFTMLTPIGIERILEQEQNSRGGPKPGDRKHPPAQKPS